MVSHGLDVCRTEAVISQTKYFSVEAHVRKGRKLYFLMEDKHPSNKENKIFTVNSVNSAFASNFSHSFNSHPQHVYGVVHTNI